MKEKRMTNELGKMRDDYAKIKDFIEKIIEDCGVSNEFDIENFSIDGSDGVSDIKLYNLVSEMKIFASEFLAKYYLDSWIDVIKKGYEPNKQDEMINIVRLLIYRDPLNAYEYYSEYFKLLDALNSDIENERKYTLAMIRQYASENTSEDVINNMFELTKTKYSEEVTHALIDGSNMCDKNYPHYVEACLGQYMQPGQ